MTNAAHLSDEERNGAADGSLAVEHRARVWHHLDTCDACASDVARIARLVKRAQQAPSADAAGAADDLWPTIHARIDGRKVVLLPAADRAPERTAPRRDRRRLAFVAAAAVLILGIGGIGAALLRGPRDGSRGEDVSAAGGPTLSMVADSTQAYAGEIQTLLNELELRRAMLRPETAAAVDQNLRVIDAAIAELQAAVTHDPNNPALRRLLASSYRQKVELLKRVGNAG